MTSKHVSVLLLLAFFGVAPVAYADSGDEATMTVVDEGDTPDDVVKVIELPDRASQRAAPGSETQNSSNDISGESGREVSEEARNKDLKDQARAEAKQAGKSDARNDNAGGRGHGPH